MANGTKGGSGGTGPSAEQLKIASQMAALISQMATMSSKISNSFESQAAATAKMAENMKEMGTGEVVTQLVEVNKTLKEVADALSNLKTVSAEVFEEVADGAGTATVSTQELTSQIKQAGEATNTVDSSKFKDLTKELSKSSSGSVSFSKKLKQIGDYLADEFPVAVGIALGALSGLQQAFSNVMAAGSSILGVLQSTASAIWEVGKAILTLPLKILGGLIEMANSSAGGSSELAEAINSLRKEFGALAGPTNSAIMGLSKSMNSLNVAGLSAMRLFGNLADRINLLRDLFLQGGPAVRSFTDEIVKSNGIILAYQKGLGLSNEEMGTMAMMAKRDGKTMTSVLNSITKQSLAMGKAFGLDAKIISKEMAKAASNMASFGHMSEKQLGIAVTYAQKLGIQLDSIAGSLDQFTTFEDAAENVSSLNSAFGTNIDLNEIMQAQDQAQQAEIVRKALLAQGVTADKLDFRYRKYIKSLTGWDDAATTAMLSTKNMSVNLKDIQKVGDKAEKKTLSQAEAMDKLADAMDRVFKSGGDRPKSFWDAFTMGLERGFKMIPGVQKLFQNIRLSTDQFTLAGMKMSQMIYDKFPGVKKMIEALTELFDPAKFKGLLDKIMGHIGKFMDDLKSGKASFKDLMGHLKDEFFSFFSKEKKGGEDLLSGFGEFFDAIKVIFAGAIEWMLTSLGNMINDVVDFLANPPDLNAGGLGAGAQKILSPIAEAFANGWSVLGPALERLFGVMMDKLTGIVLPKIQAWAEDHWKEIAFVLFGPAAFQALLGGLTALMVKGLGKMLSSAFGAASKTSSVQDAVKSMHEDISSKLSKMPGGSQAAASQPSISKEQIENYRQMETSIQWSKVLQFLVGLAGVVAIGLAAYWVALKIVKGKSIQDLIAAGAVLVIVATTAVIAAKAFQQLEKTKNIDLPTIGKFLATFAVVMGIGILAIWGMISLVKKYKIGPQDVVTLMGLTLVIGTLGVVAGGIAYIAGLVGKLPGKDLAVGLLAIGAIVGGLIYAAKEILDSLKEAKDVQPAAMEGAAKILDSIGTLAMKAGIVAGEAMAIGGIIMSTGGVAGAALVIGLASLAAIVGALSTGAVKIMGELAKMKVDNPGEFQIKVDAFVKVMGVVLDMIDKTRSILNSLSGFTSFISSTETNTKMVKQVTKFVDILFKGLKGLVDQMVAAATLIPSSQVDSIKAFASLLDSLGKLISSVGESASGFVEKTSSFWDNIGPTAWFGMKPLQVAKKMESLTKYVKVLFPKMESLIKTMIESMKGFTANPEALTAMGQTVGGILTGVGSMLQAIVPDGNKFQKTVTASFGPQGPLKYINAFGGEAKTTQVDTEAIGAAMNFMTKIIDKLSEVLPPLIASIGNTLVNIVNRVDKDKISGLSAMGSLLGAVAQLATGLIPKSTEVKFPDKSSWTLVGDNVNNITVAAPDLGKMLEDLTAKLPALIDVIIAAAAKMPTGENIQKQLDTLTTVFEMLPSLGKMAQELSNVMGTGTDSVVSSFSGLANALSGGNAKDQMIAGIYEMTEFLKAVVFSPKVLPALIDTLQRVNVLIADSKQITDAKTKLQTLFDAMGDFGNDTLKSIMEFVDDLDLSDLKKATAQVVEKTPALTGLISVFTPIGLMINEMSSALNSMSESLKTSAQIRPEDLIKQFETTIDTMVKMFTSDTLKQADKLKDSITYMQNVIGAGIVPAVKAVEDMVAGARKIESALDQGLKIDIDAKLKTFASKFGKVGAQGAYTVQARDVNIHVKFKVSMDATTIEKIMISEKSSVIKNRLNLLIDASQDDDAARNTAENLKNQGKIVPGQAPAILPGG